MDKQVHGSLHGTLKFMELYNVLVSGVQQSDSVIYIYIYTHTHTHTHIYTHIHIYIHTYIHIFFFRLFFYIGYYRILNSSYALQWFHVDYLFYM